MQRRQTAGKNKQGNELSFYLEESLHALLIDLADNIKAVPHFILVLVTHWVVCPGPRK